MNFVDRITLAAAVSQVALIAFLLLIIVPISRSMTEALDRAFKTYLWLCSFFLLFDLVVITWRWAIGGGQ